MANAYHEACIEHEIPMFLSSIVAGEFAVRQDLTTLPMETFHQLSYEMTHASQAARIFTLNEKYRDEPRAEGDRKIIQNDIKIIAQAIEDNIGIIVTADKRTLAKMVGRLHTDGLIVARAIVLADGFSLQLLLKQDDMEAFAAKTHTVTESGPPRSHQDTRSDERQTDFSFPDAPFVDEEQRARLSNEEGQARRQLPPIHPSGLREE